MTDFHWVTLMVIPKQTVINLDFLMGIRTDSLTEIQRDFRLRSD